MMKARIAIAVSVVVIFIGGPQVTAESPDKAVFDSTLAKYAEIIKRMPARFNLATAEDVDRLTVSSPIQLHIISQAAFQGGAPADLEAVITPSDSWLAPVQLDGKSVLFVDARRTNSGWKPGSAGRAPLARKWDIITATLAPGETARLITVPGISSYYVSITNRAPNLTSFDTIKLEAAAAADFVTVPAAETLTTIFQRVATLQNTNQTAP